MNTNNMFADENMPGYLKLTIKLLLVFLIVATLILASDILIPFTIAVFFTFLLLPVSRKLMQWRFPDWLAILISIIIAIGFIGGLVYFFYYQVASFSDDWPELKKSVNEKLVLAQNWINEHFNVSKREQTRWFNARVQQTASGGGILMNVFSTTGALMANFALIPIYIFFLTYYKEKYKKFIVIISNEQNHENVLNILRKISTVSQKYLKGICLDVLILSVLNSVGFILLDIKHAILFGVLAAVLNIIPYIGVLIGSILPVMMALITKDEISYALGAAGVCAAVQFIDNNFITPYVVGSSVSINPLTATLALLSGAMIWGVAGMILCMPITGMIKVVCDSVERLKPYGYLIGEEVDYRAQEHLHDIIIKKIKGKKRPVA
jgi:predicted PurR-regulated permease PerM